VDTIGSLFGGIPQTLPLPSLPPLSLNLILDVLPAALSFALLGSIESLLSATVADSMTGTRHRSNGELVAQGFANIGSALFGGICVTGAIARTATNIRAGAVGPVAGMMHSVFLLLFMLVAAPLAKFIPLASLAGILAVVCWNMAERHAFWVLLRGSRGDAAVLLTTFLLTIFRDLTEGILAGFGIGTLLFLNRISQSVEIQSAWPLPDEDEPDRTAAFYDARLASNPNILVYRISGAFFFGTAASVGAALDEIAERPKAFIIDFSQVPLLDSTAATLDGFTRKAVRKGALVYVTGATKSVRRTLMTHCVRPPRVKFRSDIPAALRFARRKLEEDTSTKQQSSPAHRRMPSRTA
jgi:SulP family sulfate permease